MFSDSQKMQLHCFKWESVVMFLWQFILLALLLQLKVINNWLISKCTSTTPGFLFWKSKRSDFCLGTMIYPSCAFFVAFFNFSFFSFKNVVQQSIIWLIGLFLSAELWANPPALLKPDWREQFGLKHSRGAAGINVLISKKNKQKKLYRPVWHVTDISL